MLSERVLGINIGIMEQNVTQTDLAYETSNCVPGWFDEHAQPDFAYSADLITTLV